MTLFRHRCIGGPAGASLWRRAAFLSLAALVLLTAGCATWRRAPAIPQEATSVERVREVLEANYGRLEQFKARGRLQIASPGQSAVLDARVLIDRPDTLYVRLEALLGIDVGWLFCDRREYLFYLPLENLYGRGPADSLRLDRFFKVTPDYEQLMGALLGLELARHLTDPQIERDESGLRLSGSSALGQHQYWIDPVRGVVTRGEVRDGAGELLLRQSFERFSRIGGVQVPRLIRLQRPRERQGITLLYEEISINKRFSAAEIKTRIAESAHRLEL